MGRSELTIELQEFIHSFREDVTRTAPIVQDRLQILVEVFSNLYETV